MEGTRRPEDVALMRLPLWVPDGEEGWILSFPSGVCLYYEEERRGGPGRVVGSGTALHDP